MGENQETKQNQDTIQDTNQDTNQNNNSSAGEQTPELNAALELIKESNATIAALHKEIADLKQANAKLAIQQSFSAPERSAEDIINDMFK